MPRKALLLLGLTACRSEQNVGADIIDYGAPNPAALSTPVQLDRIVQTTIPAIDVLFVVDNSCSMAEEQASLGGNFSAMLAWFVGSGLDYHVGVISTDMNDPSHGGRLRVVSDRRWIDPDTDEPEALFANMVQMGTAGHYAEKGRAAAYSAIELLASADNLGFVRPDAGMHISVVSDENDDSGDSPIALAEWIDYLQDFRVGARMVTFSSIVGPLTGCPYIGSPGTEYMAVTQAVGGVTWPICSQDWTQVLDELGFVAVGLTREFFLSRLPVPGTIEVRVDAQGNILPFTPADYTYSETRNSITFLEYAPQPLEVVEIEYQVLSSVFETEQPTDPPTPE
jgi:hypothetical protein